MPDNLDGVRRRARTRRTRRIATSLAVAGVFLATAAVWLPGRAGGPQPAASPSPVPTAQPLSSVQRLTFLAPELEQQTKVDFPDVDPDATVEIGLDGTITQGPPRTGIHLEEEFLPGHSDGAACAEADQFAVRFDAAGAGGPVRKYGAAVLAASVGWACVDQRGAAGGLAGDLGHHPARRRGR